MSLFKEKTKNKNDVSSPSLTIDAKHKKIMKEFTDEKKRLEVLKHQCDSEKKQLLSLEEKGKSKFTDSEMTKYFQLKDSIPELEKKIRSIEDGNGEKTYLLDTGHLLFQYYNQSSNHQLPIDVSELQKKKSTSKNSSQVSSVLDFFNKGHLKEMGEKDFTENKKPLSKSLSRYEIINQYLSKTEDNHLFAQETDDSLEYCRKCNQERTIISSEGIIVCTSCGRQDSIIIDSDKPSYKDPPREISYFAYKRINHFNEWLAQFQAKESTEIPKEVFDKILLEIKKERIQNMAELQPGKLREILKKLKLNKYYEHVPHIINRLNGLPAPVMSRDTEEKLRMMFKEIQTPFLKYCPKERKNFLSYSYVLHKFVQLLDMDEFLVCFPLLKSREKLHQQDLIWKKICDDLKWEFIKSL